MRDTKRIASFSMRLAPGLKAALSAYAAKNGVSMAAAAEAILGGFLQATGDFQPAPSGAAAAVARDLAALRRYGRGAKPQ